LARVGKRLVGTLCAHAGDEFLRFANQRDVPGGSALAFADEKVTPVKVDIDPNDVSRLVFPRAGIGEELHKVGASFGAPCARCADGFHEGYELRPFR